MYLTNPISSWGSSLSREKKLEFSLETYTTWNTEEAEKDIDLLNTIIDKNNISNEDMVLFKNIADKYNLNNQYVSTEALSGLAIAGITAAIVAVIAVIAVLLKQMSGGVNNFAASSNNALEQVVKNKPKVNPVIYNSPDVKTVVRNNANVKVTNVNTIVKVQENISKPVNKTSAWEKETSVKVQENISKPVNKSSAWEKETSVIAKAYLSYLDLLGISRDSKTLKDMDEWLTLIKSNNGDLLKTIAKILPTTTTVTSDRVNKHLGILTLNRGYNRYTALLVQLMSWNDKYIDFLEYGGYDTGLSNLVATALRIETEVGFLTNTDGTMHSSNIKVVELGYENIRDLLEKKKVLKDFNGPFSADIKSLEMDKYNDVKVKEHLSKLNAQLVSNYRYESNLINLHGKTIDAWVNYLTKFVPNTIRTIMSEYTKDVLALKVVTDFVVNSAAIVDILNSNKSE